MWIEAADPTLGPIGSQVIALQAGSLKSVAEALSQTDFAHHLKVGAGEHLSAMLLTALLGEPVAVDTSGGPDLVFSRVPEQGSWMFGNHATAHIEVKSFDGRWRKKHAELRLGDHFTVEARSALDVLRDCIPLIQRAVEGFERKGVSPESARAVFLVLNWLDASAIEALDGEGFLGFRLPTLSSDVPIDVLFVLWHPFSLTMWSQADSRWTDIFWNADTASEDDSDDDRTVDGPEKAFREAEAVYLRGVGYRKESPWFIQHDKMKRSPGLS